MDQAEQGDRRHEHRVQAHAQPDQALADRLVQRMRQCLAQFGLAQVIAIAGKPVVQCRDAARIARPGPLEHIVDELPTVHAPFECGAAFGRGAPVPGRYPPQPALVPRQVG